MKVTNIHSDVKMQQQRRFDESSSPDSPPTEQWAVEQVSDSEIQDENTEQGSLKNFLKARLKRHTAPEELITAIRQQVKGDFHFPR